MSSGDDYDVAKWIATLLGFAVVLGSLTVKLPMIKNVLACKDPNCLNMSSLYLECLSLLCSSSYSFKLGMPLSTYAELLSVFVQNIIIVGLMWHYSGKSFGFIAMVFVLLVLFEAVLLGLNPNVMWIMPLASTCISISGQFPQIMSNFRSGHTGALSIITQTLNVLGASVRVFTTIQLVNDPKTLAQNIVATTIHAVLLFQIVAMRANTAKIMTVNEDTKTTADKKMD